MSCLIVDEFPAIQADADAAGLVERLRSFGCSVALSAQSFDGLGLGQAADRQRSSIADPAQLPGSRGADQAGRHPQSACSHDSDRHRMGPTGRGSATPEQRFRVDPNLLGSLAEGEAFVVSQRRAALVRVATQTLEPELLDRAAGLAQRRVIRLDSAAPRPNVNEGKGPVVGETAGTGIDF